jgi:RNA-directed DNA polymerase
MNGTLNPVDISTKCQRIAELARREPKMVLNTLAHHVDLDWLKEAYRRTRKDGAAGVDGVTASEYEANLEANLSALLGRFKSGRYRAPAVRRVHIPKGGGRKTRPIGIPTLEDKVLQRAVVMVLEPVYEHDFLDCSYGFRPGRSAHQALDALWRELMPIGGGWVLELDIQSFFDDVDHGHLRSFLDQRVRDGVIRRMIGKWLNAGVMEDGQRHYPDSGTPQGGVISPLLANIYLHEVLDRWYAAQVWPRLRGRSFLIRYADDAVLGFSCEDDARRVLAVLSQRFAKYGLRLHPEKTRLLDFRRPPPDGGRGGGPGAGRGFDLLGFTHFWARSRRGQWVVKRKTAKDRYCRAVHRFGQWCRRYRHLPLAEQHRALSRKLQGHYGYYGITGNGPALGRFRHEVERVWRKWLDRRSNRAHLGWDRFGSVLHRYPLPPVRVMHSVYR